MGKCWGSNFSTPQTPFEGPLLKGTPETMKCTYLCCKETNYNNVRTVLETNDYAGSIRQIRQIILFTFSRAREPEPLF